MTMTAVDPGLHCRFSEAGEVMDKCINAMEDYVGKIPGFSLQLLLTLIFAAIFDLLNDSPTYIMWIQNLVRMWN